MNPVFTVNIDAWNDGGSIPSRFAFGRIGKDTPFALSDNISPAINWFNAPQNTRSFAIICYDQDVPSSAEDVNKEGSVIPATLPRVPFFHWVLVDIPPNVSGLEEGLASSGITPRGKKVGSTSYGISGKNDYTNWFAGDPEMEGIYGGYDGPCPPWNDSVLHRYHFEVFALDVDSLGLGGAFSGQEVQKAIEGHIVARGSYLGTYSINPEVDKEEKI